MSRKNPTYVQKVIRKGRTYFYTRIPGSRFVARLPDNQDGAAEVVRTITKKGFKNLIDLYVCQLLSGCSQRSRAKDLEFELTAPDVIAMLTAQNYLCAVSGIPFNISGDKNDPFSRAFAPSIDRINNDVGYTRDNCRIVVRIINYALGVWGDEVLEKVALAIVARRTKRRTGMARSGAENVVSLNNISPNLENIQRSAS